MQKQPIPRFDSEAAEDAFWQTHDSVDYIDWSTAKTVRLPELKPSTCTVSLRLPQMMVDDLKILANKRAVPYHALIKIMLAEKLREEQNAS